MKKFAVPLIILCLMLSGCAEAPEEATSPSPDGDSSLPLGFDNLQRYPYGVYIKENQQELAEKTPDPLCRAVPSDIESQFPDHRLSQFEGQYQVVDSAMVDLGEGNTPGSHWWVIAASVHLVQDHSVDDYVGAIVTNAPDVYAHKIAWVSSVTGWTERHLHELDDAINTAYGCLGYRTIPNQCETPQGDWKVCG